MPFRVRDGVHVAMSFQEIADELHVTLADVLNAYNSAIAKLARRQWEPAIDMLAVRNEAREYARAAPRCR